MFLFWISSFLILLVHVVTHVILAHTDLFKDLDNFVTFLFIQLNQLLLFHHATIMFELVNYL